MVSFTPPSEPPAGARRRTSTRPRLCAAARELFFVRGFEATTMEQIAEAAGAPRSTLYNHFRDKDEILAAIVGDYGAGLTAIIQRLPGPTPTRAQIDAWLEEVVAFAGQERTPTILLTHLGGAFQVPWSVAQLGQQLLEALAERLPAFRRAVEPGPDQGLILARALVVMNQIGQACLRRVRGEADQLAPHVLTVAAELFERFVHEAPPAAAD